MSTAFFFDSSLAHRTESPDAIVNGAQPVCRQVSDVSAVGQDRLSHSVPLDDTTREEAIHLAGRLFLKHMNRFNSGDKAALGDARRALKAQELLVKGRSAAMVARMERELGLA